MNPSFDLDNGRSIPLHVKRSARARNIRLRLTFPEGLTLILPKRFGTRVALEIVESRREWVAAQVERLLVQGCDFMDCALLPNSIELKALPAHWSVTYLPGPGSTAAGVFGAERILVRGRVEDHASCRMALKRWLGRQARAHLTGLLSSIAQETGLSFSRVTIRDQRTRWGSCSAGGGISVNQKLLFLPPDLVRYVMVHELCHGRELNHSARFWELVRSMEPHAEQCRMRMHHAWSLVPGWAV
jgi:predicted metal-dependent hydrolase